MTSKNPPCKFCNSLKTNKRDKQKYNGKQRYLCRDCGKIWTLGDDKRKKYTEDFKIEVVQWYLENVGIRSIERRMKVTDTTIIRWIKQFGKIIKDKLQETVNNIDENDFKKENIEILEIDELVTYVKKNSKQMKKEKEQKNETSASYGLLLIDNKVKLLDLRLEIEQK